MAARRVTWLVVDDIGLVPVEAVVDSGEFVRSLPGGFAGGDHLIEKMTT